MIHDDPAYLKAEESDPLYDTIELLCSQARNWKYSAQCWYRNTHEALAISCLQLGMMWLSRQSVRS